MTVKPVAGSRDCEHGALRRSCRVCELEAEVESYKRGHAQTALLRGLPLPLDVERLMLAVEHERFFHLERFHLGHIGDCPHVDEDGQACWRWRVGVAVRPGRCSWWEGATWREAVEKAAADIAAGKEPQ